MFPERLLYVVHADDEYPRDRLWPSAPPAEFHRRTAPEDRQLRIPVTRFEGERKMGQNRPAANRIGVTAGIAASDTPRDREVAADLHSGLKRV